jgi:hypothetical protein
VTTSRWSSGPSEASAIRSSGAVAGSKRVARSSSRKFGNSSAPSDIVVHGSATCFGTIATAWPFLRRRNATRRLGRRSSNACPAARIRPASTGPVSEIVNCPV